VVSDLASRRFFAWRAMHPNQAEDMSAVWAAAWQAGGRDALVKSAQLAELVPRLEELAALFWSGKVERDLEQDDPAAYDWAMSNAMAEERAITHPDEDDQEQEVLPF